MNDLAIRADLKPTISLVGSKRGQIQVSVS